MSIITTPNDQDSHSSDWDMYYAYLLSSQQNSAGNPPISDYYSLNTTHTNNNINNLSVNIDYNSDSSNDSYYDSMPPLIDNNDDDLYDDDLSDTDTVIVLSDPPGIDLHPKQNALLP